jgi:hypothetical protein
MIQSKKDPKLKILKVMLWTLFAVWVCFLGYCANGHNQYRPDSNAGIEKHSVPGAGVMPSISAQHEDSMGNVDGPKSYFVREHGSIRGGIRTERIENTGSEGK